MVVNVLAAEQGGARRAAQGVSDNEVGQRGAGALQCGQSRHLIEGSPVQIVGEQQDHILDL